MRIVWLFALCLVLVGCGESPIPPKKYQMISGRNRGRSIYRLVVPEGWQRVNPSEDAALEDTKIALCDFYHGEGDRQIRIAIHNFPYRIPPEAQIARWREQSSESEWTQPLTQGGFVGLRYEARGVIGWALQLDHEHWQTLGAATEMRSDVTIKATGPCDLLDQHREAISALAASFELIQEIPTAP